MPSNPADRAPRGLLLALAFVLLAPPIAPPLAAAQDLTFATVDRPPFSEETPQGFHGFSIELMPAIAEKTGRSVSFRRVEHFPELFAALESDQVDGAIANISITASARRRWISRTRSTKAGCRSWCRATAPSAAAFWARVFLATS